MSHYYTRLASRVSLKPKAEHGIRRNGTVLWIGNILNTTLDGKMKACGLSTRSGLQSRNQEPPPLVRGHQPLWWKIELHGWRGQITNTSSGFQKRPRKAISKACEESNMGNHHHPFLPPAAGELTNKKLECPIGREIKPANSESPVCTSPSHAIEFLLIHQKEKLNFC